MPRDVWVDRVADYVLENGAASLSVRALALHHGVSPQAVTKHFGTKDQMISEGMQRALARDALALESMVRDMHSVADLLEEIVKALKKPSFRRMVAVQCELYGTAAGAPAEFGHYAERCTRLGQSSMLDQIRRDGLDDQRAQAVADMLLSAVRGLLMGALGGWSNARVDAVAGEILSWYEAQFD